MIRIQLFFSGLLLATSLLATSTLTTGCYTQFATTNSIERLSSPNEVDVEELVENGGNVTINNYYDFYYSHFVRPTIYGFAGTWGWYDPFWGYPLWYTPVFVPVFYYGWGGVWGWNRWGGWNPYFPPYWAGGVASSEAIGTRRIGIGRARITGIGNPIFPTNSSLRYGSSSEGGTVVPDARRRRDGTTTTAPADASRRNSRSYAPNGGSEKQSRVRGSSESSRRQSSGERRSPSYSAPSQRGSSSFSAPSRSGGSSSGSSSSGSSGRRQR